MGKKASILYEIILFSMAVLSVSTIWLDSRQFFFLDKVVWGIFVLDFLIRLFRSENKIKFIKENPFDLIAIIPLDNIFQLARLARLIRLVRIILLSKRHAKPFFAILKTNGLDKILGIIFVVMLVSSLLIKLFEPSIKTYQDALWWSMVTATTVGYGDISPETGMGRVIAAILMLLGIGLIGMVTSSISTYFLSGHKRSNPTIEHLKNELDRYDELTPSELNRMILILKDLHNEKLDKKQGA
ncbi:ion transport 2 domain-containing protein [Neobacillus bataviensis LMG 21833]|uniref:Ion transport 2 domain-containing protein n=1 Tax=Neobacillus bataviensis LMG 21833 TaxID=1117379 RepID=K6CTQ8_9BACI|nr:potassium channel family protein [Neobacillus bataviensis]EKN63627.1 ion transport 2 domain-containing protein [Neobacillus bataviensis LMG 21833]